MRKVAILLGLAILSIGPSVDATGSSGFSFTVVPFEFDPRGTHLVAAQWKGGIGCPTNAKTAPFLPPDFSTVGWGMFTDLACITGDQGDNRVQGLLLAKTGPTNNNASAGATIVGVKGKSLTELGYDIRKVGFYAINNVPPSPPSLGFLDPRGSHCGAGAPRFNVIIGGDRYFIGCASPPPTSQIIGDGWLRLRWGGAGGPLLAFGAACPDPNVPCDISGRPIDALSILFDEGQDTAPDHFGLAVLDNIDVNGKMVGRGPNKPEDDDCDEGHGKDNHDRHFKFRHSSSRPESSSMSYEDRSQGVKVQTVSGARAITYTGTCVSFVSDALVNDAPGHVVNFAACDLSALSTPLTPKIGSYTILVTGASGVVYQKTGTLTAGQISIHSR